MKVSIDLCVVPVGVGVSVSTYVAACATIIRDAGLTFNINANNTEIEGEWDTVFAAVKRCHEVVHAMGAPRIVTSMRVNTRMDDVQDEQVLRRQEPRAAKVQSMADKIHSVQLKLGQTHP